uniref:uncharacterized protein LOC120337796 n=1 Tax=Styela clava TaxID=7725 RepID=UPI0019396CCE|nr:uncharacterized protein LOC120337796 [Styela clava]
MDDDEEDIDVILLFWLSKKKESQRSRRIWTHPINKKRSVYGSYHHVFHELSNDRLRFCSYSRMSLDCFNILVSKITPFVKKRRDTNSRKYIRVEERLVVTLRYLATGLSFRQMTFDFRMGETTIGKIVEEICEAILKVLKANTCPHQNRMTGLKLPIIFTNCGMCLIH